MSKDITTLAAKLKGLEQNDSGMFEISDDLICEVVEALEAAGVLNKHLDLAVRKAEGCSEALRRKAEAAEKRIAELEARTLTVKLPREVQVSNFPFAALGANAMRKEVIKALTEDCAAAGIKLQIEE